jgi:hypothetical protein
MNYDFVSSGSVSDILYALPAIRDLGGGRLYLRGKNEFKALKNLLEIQPYIEYVRLYEGEGVDFCFDNVKDLENFGHNPLVHSFRRLVGLPYIERISPWIAPNETRLTNCPEKFVILNRSLQYHDTSDFWITKIKEEIEKESDMYFLGFPEEYRSFQRNIVEGVSFIDASDLSVASMFLKQAYRIICGSGAMLALSQAMGLLVEFEVDKNRNLNYLL